MTFGVNIGVCDTNRYERKNLSNQLWLHEDIGDFKVEALAERYAEVYELSVGTVTQYVKTIDMLDRLFAEKDISKEFQQVKVLISSVDNNDYPYFFKEQKTSVSLGAKGLRTFLKFAYLRT